MQPYQRASEETKRQGELPHQALKTVGSLAATAIPAAKGIAQGLGAGLALKSVLPYLNKYIPADLAIKGLNKIDPRFGKFVDKALKSGKSFDEIKDFIRDKAEEEPEQEEQKKAQENRNVIEQYSPELNQFLMGEIQQGRSPLEAGAIAQTNQKFKSAIKKIEKDHKTNWSTILQNVFGGVQQAQQPQGAGQPMPGQGQPQPVQQGQGMQNLMQALQAATQARQKRQGPQM